MTAIFKYYEDLSLVYTTEYTHTKIFVAQVVIK